MQTFGLSSSTPKPSNRVRDLLWPVIKDEVSALTAARNGMYVSFLVALVTGVVALLTNPLGLLDAALFLMVGIGIRQLSRVAAVTGLVLYVLSIVARAVQGQFGALGVIGVIFTAILASAVRAAFFAHRWKREHPADIDLGQSANDRRSPAGTSSHATLAVRQAGLLRCHCDPGRSRSYAAIRLHLCSAMGHPQR